MISDHEQRESPRVLRDFWVTDYDDAPFSEPLLGVDVNLTGLSFWVDQPDLFFPGQPISLRVKNAESGEVYCLEGVTVIHVRPKDERYLCGCHITHVTSSQLLAHHRLEMADGAGTEVRTVPARLSEFDLIGDEQPLSSDQADYQKAGMALSLASLQMKQGRDQSNGALEKIEHYLATLENETLQAELTGLYDRFSSVFKEMTDATMALTMLAKLLAHTPGSQEEKRDWQRMISDFENRYLTEEQRTAYDFMHQGLTADEAVEAAQACLENEAC